MTGLRQTVLVALREVRERGRSRAFLAGLVVMLVAVVAGIVLPSYIEAPSARDVGVTGPHARPVAATLRHDRAEPTLTVRTYPDLASGQDAVRAGDVDVLVVGGQRLLWDRRVDEGLRSRVATAVQQVAVQERAAATDLTPQQLAALLAPVPLRDVVAGPAEGRTPEDAAAAVLITAVLLMVIFLYGNLVLTGVVEEKTSRVVEVLLARMPPRNLLLGKVAGIGLLGLAQVLVTALAALAATFLVDSVDLPALSGGVLAWVVVWFLLGYVLYAVLYGALGSLASRAEDAQSVAGPVGYVLVIGYWASFLAVSDDPEGTWARLLSLFPVTSPFAMPGRIALGTTSWWEPLLAVVLALAAIGVLVVAGGRMYAAAILRSGPTVRLREAWRSVLPPTADTRLPSAGPGR